MPLLTEYLQAITGQKVGFAEGRASTLRRDDGNGLASRGLAGPGGGLRVWRGTLKFLNDRMFDSIPSGSTYR
ncbi:hypothetical protein Cob_v006461 [Colletotrichum orbiculare MAFF 240422]|uniref:Uncharacterized protein n=1 Tax=Colletotrichum orbiculare (strain 104-T / ATCC 96160 / CBS 514.97 / LARS 414 / MAFF 240422) TaxID=1213857 RepID=A0A484FPD5_COLOR|nr:hypothetical protein Cob_v006461 [Colletotrichum orbiculare MAFF 240422]